MTTTRDPLITTPRAFSVLARGIETLATPLALTLGPGKGFVLNELNQHQCEILADSSTIARRVIRLPGRGNNLGAMMLRRMALDMQERFGDGVATATVMVKAMIREAGRLIAAGVNPALLARGLELAVEAATTALVAQARPVEGLEELVALALSVTGDRQLSETLGQMFDVMGASATVITQDIPRPYLDHEYIRGGKWDGYLPARQVLPEGEAGLILHRPLIVLADEELRSTEQVQPILELALAQPEKPPLLIIARAITGDALTMLTTNHVRGVLTIGMLVLSSGSTLVLDDLEDIAALTDGRALSAITGSLVENLRLSDLGRTQRAVLNENGVIIAGGAGKQTAIQQRCAAVRARLKQVSRADAQEWEFLRVRLARLTGGIGVLKYGTSNEQEREMKKALVSKALRVLEEAYEGGLVPGGGAAFLACLPALEQARARCQQADEQQGMALLAVGLQAPFLQIVRNSSEIHPPLALDEVLRLGAGYGFDAQLGDYVSLAERHILDCLSVSRGALEAAASLASMVITTDAIVFSV